MKISSGMYLVHSDEEFDSAIEQEFSAEYGDWEFVLRTMTDGRPSVYPSIISLSRVYRGDYRFHCNSISVDEVQKVIG